MSMGTTRNGGAVEFRYVNPPPVEGDKPRDVVESAYRSGDFCLGVGRAARLEQLRTRNASFGRLPRDVETVLAWLSHLGTSSEW